MAVRHAHRLQNSMDIPIASDGTISGGEGYLWVADATDIQWDNSAGTVQYDIIFTIGNMANQSAPPRQKSGTVTASGISVNYVIQNHTTRRQTGGPYCIQWGNGVLGISVYANSNAFEIAVPATTNLYQANIQFTSDDEYSILWTHNGQPAPNVWITQPPDVYATPPGNVVQHAALGAQGPYVCTFGNAVNVPQKGTVHIGG